MGRGAAGGRIGRPPALDDAAQAAVRADLEAGMTVAAVARRYNTSHQTILRIRDARKQS
ncbi:helix-turn-helix domain-containing protein [Epibacterium sp. Ofav1-8]|uniref:helix-turn-helix domain-containing protein n=1 Tax=Epibacterium sp. Ofav1-8 TaxID=2917735 RepID=UPI001EF51038|nr:helix-turn-helix domain-containing protein [Epibacterium sp. Ofav1-8]MCG7626003.1 helix-turn-helix domain-containing protein [Epibacterium sp. Ofav1-8]